MVELRVLAGGEDVEMRVVSGSEDAVVSSDVVVDMRVVSGSGGKDVVVSPSAVVVGLYIVSSGFSVSGGEDVVVSSFAVVLVSSGFSVFLFIKTVQSRNFSPPNPSSIKQP